MNYRITALLNYQFRIALMILITICLFTETVLPDTLYVPSVDYVKIQDAIDAASDGDTIIVAPNTYFENIDYLGKELLIKSTHGKDFTIIDGLQSGSVVSLSVGNHGTIGGEGPLEGFSITNGIGGIDCHGCSVTIQNNAIVNNLDGAGIFCNQSNQVTIKDNTIANNETDTNGGGIFCQNIASIATIDNNIIKENSAERGGGIYFYHCTDINITNNRIYKNTAKRGGGISCHGYIFSIRNNLVYENSTDQGDGGGILCWDGYSSSIINNTIYKNSSAARGGGICCIYCSLTLWNTICWKNMSPTDPEIYAWSGGELLAYYCDVKGGWPGINNIDEDPMFSNADEGDFHLSYNSPCKDTGHNSVVTDIHDFEGDPRITNGTVDIGADEFYNHFYCTGDFTPSGR